MIPTFSQKLVTREIIFSALDIACPFTSDELHPPVDSAANETENTTDGTGSDIKRIESLMAEDPARAARLAVARRYRAVRRRLCTRVRERLS